MKLNQVETNFQLMLSNIERMQVQAHEKCNLVINTLNLLKRHVRQNQDAHVEMSCRNVFFSAAMQYDLSPQSFIMTRQNFTNVVNMKEKKTSPHSRMSTTAAATA